MNKVFGRFICTFLVLISGMLFSFQKEKNDILHPLSVTDVHLDGEIGRRISLTIEKNLLAINIQDQLNHFRNQKSVPQLRDGFCGIGMFIDGLVSFAAYKNDPSLITYKEQIITDLIKTQDNSGYIGLYLPGSRKQLWDTHESSYIILALANDYKYFGKSESLNAAIKLADNMLKSKDKYTCGFEPALLALYKVTSDKKYLEYCLSELGLPQFKGGSEHHSTHVYGYLARAYAQLLLNDIAFDPQLFYRSKAAFENMITFHAMDVTGTVGSWEHWNNTQSGIGACGETCATAYELRMLDKLLQQEKNSVYGDVMERVIYNALFAAQSPDGRKLRYFTPFEDKREYYPDDYFCCPNNFRRIMAELPGFAYYKSDKGIYVNLYGSSKAKFQVHRTQVAISQQSDYPTSEKSNFQITLPKPTSFSLFLRIPSWCKNPQLMINNTPYTGEIKRGHFLEIKRKWNNNDRVSLNLSMNWRFVGGKMSQYGRATLLRGPIVYCLSNVQNNNLLDTKKIKQKIVIDPLSISDVEPDSLFRPNGIRCSATVYAIDGRFFKNTRLIFTEFIDPDGIKTYIDIPDSVFFNVVEDDEFMLKDEW